MSWALVMTAAARAAGVSAWSVSSWGRWDTGHYLRIAESGYAFGPCDGVANRGPEDFCGSSGWFPLYPYAIRAATWTGLRADAAGRLLALGALLTAWVALWFGFLRRHPMRRAIPAMALAAVFPGCVYYGAIFPVSTVVAATVIAAVCVDRQRWVLAGLAAAVAAMAYSSGLLVGAMAVVPLLSRSVGPSWAVRVRAAISVAAPAAVGYLLVLVNFQRATGHWDAWFKTQASYDFAPAFPPVTLARQVGHLGDDVISGWVGLQSLLVAVIVVLAVWIVATSRAMLSLGERAAAIAVGCLWVFPLLLGGDLSLYRAEALLFPAVILLVRLRPILIWMLVVPSVVVAYRMAELFFEAVLI